MSNGFSDNIELFLDHGCLQTGDEGGEGDEALHGRDAGGAPAQGQVGHQGVQGNGFPAAAVDTSPVAHCEGLGPGICAQAPARAESDHLSRGGLRGEAPGDHAKLVRPRHSRGHRRGGHWTRARM